MSGPLCEEPDIIAPALNISENITTFEENSLTTRRKAGVVSSAIGARKNISGNRLFITLNILQKRIMSISFNPGNMAVY